MGAPKGNQYAKGNKGGGRPTDYKAKFAKQAQRACEAGFTDGEIAELIGVGETTLNAWKLAHPEFSEALKIGKDPANERVLRSLYKRAVGFEYVETEQTIDSDGKKRIKKTTKYLPPDTSAAFIWAKNRCGWRDKFEHQHTGGVRVEVDSVADAISDPETRKLAIELAERLACIPGDAGAPSDSSSN